MTLFEWAERWQIPPQALMELAQLPEPGVEASKGGASETNVQSRVRLEASRRGVKLFRNNVGVLVDVDGRPVRYGLANDSKKLNAAVKSADLIGLRPVLIQPHHVGHVIGQFVSRECKREGWRFNANDPADCAQVRWQAFINVNGGDAAIVQSEGSL